MFASKDTLLTRPSGGYSIARSVRIRSSAQGYFSKTLTTPTNNKKWTYSVWMKRGSLSANRTIMSSNVDGAEYWDMRFNTSDQIYIQNRVGSSNLLLANTTAVYRDPSAWYHIVFIFDSDNATAANRNLLYVNSVNVALSANSGSSDASAWNTSGVQHNIGVSRTLTSGGGIWAEYDGYETEINFVDGQALTPSSFGETDSITGVWKPKAYSGTYGTNGFELNFSDNSNNTAATIGKDYSGNGNNWTPNNISVTAGATYDSMTDVPTLTSATAANYPVWNPLKAIAGTYSSANLGVVRSGAPNVDLPVSTLQIPKTVPIYFEISFGNQDSSYGIAKDTSNSGANGIVGSSSDGASYGAYVTTDSSYYGFWNNNSRTSFNFSGGTIYQMAFDQANGKLWFGKDNTWYNSGNPTNGTNPTFSSISTTTDFFVAALASTSAASINFGQRPFSYTPPTGFVALNTYNLPASTIKNGAAYMNTLLYTGDGNTTKSITGLSFAPDFVWHKTRSNADDHRLVDIVRGGGTDLSSSILYSNLTNAQDNSSGYITQTSSGFNLGVAATPLNMSGRTYVAWNWKAGGTAASNTNGTITSTVSVGATQGFSVVTYTGNGTSGATVGHGLGVAPSMVIVKRRDSSTNGDWFTYTSMTGNTNTLFLNLTNASSAGSGSWNNTSPTSSVFTVGTSTGVNASASTYVAYCFAPVAGYSAFGSYTGNGSADGPFIYTGFRPRFILVKSSSGAFDWHITDTSRSTYNQADTVLFPNSSAAETNGGGYYYDLLSNGFKCRNLGSATNGSGATYIFAAFAEVPFKTSLAR